MRYASSCCCSSSLTCAICGLRLNSRASMLLGSRWMTRLQSSTPSRSVIASMRISASGSAALWSAGITLQRTSHATHSRHKSPSAAAAAAAEADAEAEAEVNAAAAPLPKLLEAIGYVGSWKEVHLVQGVAGVAGAAVGPGVVAWACARPCGQLLLVLFLLRCWLWLWCCCCWWRLGQIGWRGVVWGVRRAHKFFFFFYFFCAVFNENNWSSSVGRCALPSTDTQQQKQQQQHQRQRQRCERNRTGTGMGTGTATATRTRAKYNNYLVRTRAVGRRRVCFLLYIQLIFDIQHLIDCTEALAHTHSRTHTLTHT